MVNADIEADIEAIREADRQGSNWAHVVLYFYEKLKEQPHAVCTMAALQIAYRDWKARRLLNGA